MLSTLAPSAGHARGRVPGRNAPRPAGDFSFIPGLAFWSHQAPVRVLSRLSVCWEGITFPASQMPLLPVLPEGQALPTPGPLPRAQTLLILPICPPAGDQTGREG